ncbi:MAG: tetratricopeptide repeat protein [Planctomycetes bacterium]|nr:tetratricopeptide repeat protein [Planctomycetota bacterium]
MEKARGLLAAGDRVAAAEAFRTCIDRCPDLIEAHIAYQDALLGRPSGGSSSAVSPESIQSMRQLYDGLKDRPSSPEVPFLRARLQRLDRREEPARLGLEEALRRDPNFYLAYHELGQLWRGVDKLDRAAESFAKALALRADFAPARRQMAEVAAALGRGQQAMDSYRLYLKDRPGDLDAKRALLSMLAYQDSGSPDEAAKLADELLEVRPEDLTLLMDRAAVHWRQGEMEKAAELYRRVVQRDPKRARAVLNYGNLMFTIGQRTPAGPERKYRLAKARSAFLYYRTLHSIDDAYDWFDLHLAVRVRLSTIEGELGKPGPAPVTWRDL